MELRVTPTILFDQTITFAQQQEASLAQLQQEAATGLRVLQPSDDPISAVAAMAANAQDLRLTTNLENVQAAISTLNASSAALQDVNNVFNQANQIAVQANNSTSSATSNASLADQVNAL